MVTNAEGLVEIVAASPDEAEAVIFTLLRECAEGKRDREADALILAIEWGVDPKWVRESFVVARKRWLAAQAGDVFILPAPQPSVEIGAPASTERLGTKLEAVLAKQPPLKIRRIQQLMAEPAALTRALMRRDGGKAEPSLSVGSPTKTTSPGVSENSDPPRKVPNVSFGTDDAINDEDPAVLSPTASYDNAREFARRRCWKAGSLAVYFWSGKFWEWNGRIYEAVPEAELKSAVYRFLDESVKKEGQDLMKVRFRPKQSHVYDLLDGLRAGLTLPGRCDPPMRLDTGERAGEILAFKKGLVEVTSGGLLPATPKLWIHDEVPYEWQPDAKCPEWLAFLGSIFPGDQEAQDCVEELLGLTMTEDLAFQKGALLVGEPRSGKGTILKVGEALIGTKAYVSLELDKWTMGENSGERLIGRKMLAFPDVRLKPPRWYGANFDPGGVDHKSVELLLRITGGDRVSLGRKYIGDWEGSLPGKVWIVSNKVPNFNDAVLPTRFVKLAFDQNFLGREDIYLADRLLANELPGIAARGLRAYWRLRERRHFVQPRSAARLEREIAQTSDAFTQFVLETFIADPDGSVAIGQAFSELETWCGENGRRDILRGITPMNFAGRLRTVGGFEQIDTFKPHGKPRRYKFMRLRKAGEGDDEW